MVHLLQSTIVNNSLYCVECIQHTLAILPTSHNYWLMFANQLWADHFGIWLIAKLFYSVHKKLQTCGADFKYYEVADLRLRISIITKLQTCGCGLQELRSCGLAVAYSRILKRGCGLAFADWGNWNSVADLRTWKKKLAVSSTEISLGNSEHQACKRGFRQALSGLWSERVSVSAFWAWSYTY